MQLGTDLRNAMINQYETIVGTAPRLLIFTGAAPAACGSATSGTMLLNLPCPSDWLTAGSNGTASKNGTWQGTAGTNGTAGHYRVYNAGTSTCSEQGTVGTSGADLNLDNSVMNSGQVVTITQWDRNIGLA
jgi:hypothetical protein